MVSEPIRILIADDSCDFSEMLCSYISLYSDIQVIGIARNGNEALELVQRHKPDVLLLDLIMPEMDGLEVLRRLRSSSGHMPHVFCLSAVSSEAAAYQSVNLGATYLLKPIEAKVIVAKIRSVMQASGMPARGSR